MFRWPLRFAAAAARRQLNSEKETVAQVPLERLKPSWNVLVALAGRTAAVKEAPHQDVIAFPLREEIAPWRYPALPMSGLSQLLKTFELLTVVKRASWNYIAHKKARAEKPPPSHYAS